jgi:ABC-type nickel/cobalt efflux system permease component RcnA
LGFWARILMAAALLLVLDGFETNSRETRAKIEAQTFDIMICTGISGFLTTTRLTRLNIHHDRTNASVFEGYRILPWAEVYFWSLPSWYPVLSAPQPSDARAGSDQHHVQASVRRLSAPKQKTHGAVL